MANYFSDEQVKEALLKTYEELGIVRLPEVPAGVIQFNKALMNLAVDTAKSEAVAYETIPSQYAHHSLKREITRHKPIDKPDWMITSLYRIKELSNG